MKRGQMWLAASAALAIAAAVPAQAVVFDGRNLPPCYSNDSPYVPPLRQRSTIAVELWLCEEVNHVSAIFVGDFIDVGETLDVDWNGQFWRGSLSMRQDSTSAGDRFVTAKGTTQHKVPGGAPEWSFGPLEGGGTGDKFLETRDGERGVVPHDAASDVYTALFLMDEGRALFNFAPSPRPHNVVHRGWTLEITGRHGPGPFDFFGPKKPFEIQLDPQLAPVPLPWSAPLLGLGLAILCTRARHGGPTPA